MIERFAARSCISASAVTLLPEPDFADERQHLAAADREGDVLGQRNALAADVDGDREVADLEGRALGLGHHVLE